MGDIETIDDTVLQDLLMNNFNLADIETNQTNNNNSQNTNQIEPKLTINKNVNTINVKMSNLPHMSVMYFPNSLATINNDVQK